MTMMIGTIEKIIRLDHSPYHGPDFLNLEREMVESLGHEYQSIDASKGHWPAPQDYDGPVILITNTHTPTHDIKKYIQNDIHLIIHPNSGHDNFNKHKFQELGIPIILGNSIRAPGVSEYILAHIFYHYSFIDHEKLWRPDRKWDRDLLENQTVLLIGHGHIGSKVKLVLSPIVQNIIISDPKKGFEINLDQEISKADIIIFACDLNSSNQKLLNETLFSKMKDNVLIVNAARGQLIDQNALIAYLSNNPKSYAILDVFEKEPFKENTFEKIINIKVTSHVAGVSKDLDQRILQFEKEVLTSFSKNTYQEFEEKYDEILLSRKNVTLRI